MSKRVSKKKQNEHFNLFLQRWNKWRLYLDQLVLEHSGILICPDNRNLVTENNIGRQGHPGSIKISLPHPICLYNIPRSLNAKGQAQTRLTVFIDGGYELEEDRRDHVRRMKSEVAFYEMSTSKNPQLRLIDAYHFDFFDEDNVNATAPHPAFHVQRHIRMNQALEDRFKLSLSQIPSLKNYSFKHTESDISKLFQFGTFRIPTPQLDILNLGALIAADQLVGFTSARCWSHFQNLLTSIHGANGDHHHVKQPPSHEAVFYTLPRKKLADWYCKR